MRLLCHENCSQEVPQLGSNLKTFLLYQRTIQSTRLSFYIRNSIYLQLATYFKLKGHHQKHNVRVQKEGIWTLVFVNENFLLLRFLILYRNLFNVP